MADGVSPDDVSQLFLETCDGDDAFIDTLSYCLSILGFGSRIPRSQNDEPAGVTESARGHIPNRRWWTRVTLSRFGARLWFLWWW